MVGFKEVVVSPGLMTTSSNVATSWTNSALWYNDCKGPSKVPHHNEQR